MRQVFPRALCIMLYALCSLLSADCLCTPLHIEATAQLAGLADYSITQATLDDPDAKIKAFAEALDKYRTSRR